MVKSYSPSLKHKLIVKEVHLAKKGQITIPKAIRDEDGLKENDTFIVTHTYNGEIVFKVKKKKDPVDCLIKIIKSGPKIDAEKAWKEILEERKRER